MYTMKKSIKDHSSIAALAHLALTIVLAFLVIRQTDRAQSETQRFAWLPYHAPVLLNVRPGNMENYRFMTTIRIKRANSLPAKRTALQ